MSLKYEPSSEPHGHAGARLTPRVARGWWRTHPGWRFQHLMCFFFFTLVTGPRRSLRLKLSDTRVYEPSVLYCYHLMRSTGVQPTGLRVEGWDTRCVGALTPSWVVAGARLSGTQAGGDSPREHMCATPRLATLTPVALMACRHTALRQGCASKGGIHDVWGASKQAGGADT